jgi:hypothetical protein
MYDAAWTQRQVVPDNLKTRVDRPELCYQRISQSYADLAFGGGEASGGANGSSEGGFAASGSSDDASGQTADAQGDDVTPAQVEDDNADSAAEHEVEAALDDVKTAESRASDDAKTEAQTSANDGSDTKSVGESDYVNLASDARTQHILDGHMLPGEPGNTLFPSEWSAGKIMNGVSEVATDPDNSWGSANGPPRK